MLTPTVFRPLMMRPGMLPTYVRLEKRGQGLVTVDSGCCQGGNAAGPRPHLCPRMSDWSQTPPKAMRWNSLPRVLAMERPTLVLPTPGGPTKQRMGPWQHRRSVTHAHTHTHLRR